MIGVNLSSAEYSYDTYPTTDALDFAASEGLDLIRLPVAWEKLQPTLNGPLDQVQVDGLSNFLDAAAARGIQVIVDLHNYGHYASVASEAPQLTGYGGDPIGSSAVPISAFATFWSELAAEVKGHAALAGYDIMNEPHGLPSPAVWPAAAQAAVDAIRSVDSKRPYLLKEMDGQLLKLAGEQREPSHRRSGRKYRI